MAGGRVMHQCNKLCNEKFAEEIKANNKKENEDLVKMIVECVESCMDRVNELLRERGHEDLVEPFTHTEFD